MLQALERASRDEKKYAYLLKSTIGVIFLGTPLRGTPTASVAQWVALIRGFMGKETSGILLQSLKNESDKLDTLVHDFSKLAIKLAKAHNFQIRCFYETRASQIANVISNQIARFFPIPEVKVHLTFAIVLFCMLISSNSLFPENQHVSMVMIAFRSKSLTQ